jgi:hypothetical protein
MNGGNEIGYADRGAAAARSCRIPSRRRTALPGRRGRRLSRVYPALARVDELFGVSVVGTGGAEYTAGDGEVLRDDERHKPFVFALVARGARPTRFAIGSG